MADACFAEAHVAAAGHRVDDSAVQAAVAWELAQFHSKLPVVMFNCLRRMLLCQIFGQLVCVQDESTHNICVCWAPKT
jgi:hypothetical protein